MDSATGILGLIFGVFLFIWFKKTHMIIMTDWFYGNLKLGFGCVFAGCILAWILLKLLGGILFGILKVALGILNVVKVIFIIVFVLIIIFGVVILIYAYRHRTEVGSTYKPERTGIYEMMDHLTQKLWEVKGRAYGIYGVTIAGIVVISLAIINNTVLSADHTTQTIPQQETIPQIVVSEPVTESEPLPEEPTPVPMIDLQTLCGEWPVSDRRNAQCTVSQTETGEYQITVSKTDHWTGQHEVLGPLILQAVSETSAEASYEEDGLGHCGVVEIGTLEQDGRPYIRISAENNGSGSYDDFTFEMNSYLLRPEDIEEERHTELENLVIRYVDGLTRAVSENDFWYIASYMMEGSSMYQTQQNLIADYAERGISESLEDVSVVGYEKIDETTYRVLSQETIHVTFADGRGKTVEQSYWYTAVQQDDQWLLTDMEEA